MHRDSPVLEQPQSMYRLDGLSKAPTPKFSAWMRCELEPEPESWIGSYDIILGKEDHAGVRTRNLGAIE